MPPKKTSASTPKVPKQAKSKTVKKKAAASAANAEDVHDDDDEDIQERSGTPESVASSHSSVSSRKSCRLTDHEELSLLAFLKDTPCIWDQKNLDYRKPQLKEMKWEQQAVRMKLPTTKLQAAFKNLRDWNNRIDKESSKSGSGLRVLTDREKLVVDRLAFLQTTVRHRTAPIQSVEQAKQKEGGNLEEAQRLAEENREAIRQVDRDTQSKSPKKKKTSVDSEAIAGLHSAISSQEEQMLTLVTQVKKMSGPDLSPSEPDYERKAFSHWVLSQTLTFSEEEFERYQSSFITLRETFLAERRLRERQYQNPGGHYYPQATSTSQGPSSYAASYGPSPYPAGWQQPFPPAPTPYQAPSQDYGGKYVRKVHTPAPRRRHSSGQSTGMLDMRDPNVTRDVAAISAVPSPIATIPPPFPASSLSLNLSQYMQENQEGGTQDDSMLTYLTSHKESDADDPT